MALIEILGWEENFVGFTGWDAHATAELKKQLRRGIKASPGEIRRLARRIHARQLVSLHDVQEEAVFGLTQLLQTTGANFRVSLEHNNSTKLFKRCAKR